MKVKSFSFVPLKHGLNLLSVTHVDGSNGSPRGPLVTELRLTDESWDVPSRRDSIISPFTRKWNVARSCALIDSASVLLGLYEG